MNPLRKVVSSGLWYQRLYLNRGYHFRRDVLECGHTVEIHHTSLKARAKRRCDACITPPKADKEDKDG